MSPRLRLWIGVIFLALLIAAGVSSIYFQRPGETSSYPNLEPSTPAVKNIETH